MSASVKTCAYYGNVVTIDPEVCMPYEESCVDTMSGEVPEVAKCPHVDNSMGCRRGLGDANVTACRTCNELKFLEV